MELIMAGYSAMEMDLDLSGECCEVFGDLWIFL